MRKEKAFVDALGFVSTENENDGLAISFWNTKEGAEAFVATPAYQAILAKLMPLVDNVSIRSFNVTLSTFHKIMAAHV